MYDLTEFNNLVCTCFVAGWKIEVRDCWDGRQIILKDKDCIGYMDAKEVLEIWAENIVKNESYIAD